MNQGEYMSDGELGMVIAAAAYAISSLEEDSTLNKRISFAEPEKFLPRTKTRSEDKITITKLSGSFKRWFTNREKEEDEELAVDSSPRKSAIEEQTMMADTETTHSTAQKPMNSVPSFKKKTQVTENNPQKPMESAPSFKKKTQVTENNPQKPMESAPSFKKKKQLTETNLNYTGNDKIVGSRNETKPDSRPPSIKKPTISTRMPATLPRTKIYANFGGKTNAEIEAEAYAWEKEKMEKVKNKYNKMISLIEEWENEKKVKAKQHMELRKNGPEHKRASAMQKYSEEISRIDKVAGEARAMAEEKRRNGEAKTREKARQIRLTGKVPHGRCCF